MPQLYTRSGDNGTTTLHDMYNVSKADWIFKVIGDLEELSAHIGLLCVSLKKYANETDSKYADHVRFLRKVQMKLTELGNNFATAQWRQNVVKTTTEDVKNLEAQIDFLTTESVLLTCGESDCHAYICRAICRRAERNMWTLVELEESNRVENEAFQYMNRLSSYFYALARYLTQNQKLI